MVIPATSIFGTHVLLVLDFKPFESNNYMQISYKVELVVSHNKQIDNNNLL